MLKTKIQPMPGLIAKGQTNGAFQITYLGRKLTFGGGPYRGRYAFTDKVVHAPQKHGLPVFTVKVAEEQPGEASHTMSVVDFGVPTPAQLRFAVEEAIVAAFAGRAVYAGCMGGIGRTGTFLAAIIKVFYPLADPVGTVRAHYLGHAVETRAQEKLLGEFDVGPIRRRLPILAFKAWFGR